MTAGAVTLLAVTAFAVGLVLTIRRMLSAASTGVRSSTFALRASNSVSPSPDGSTVVADAVPSVTVAFRAPCTWRAMWRPLGCRRLGRRLLLLLGEERFLLLGK